MQTSKKIFTLNITKVSEIRLKLFISLVFLLIYSTLAAQVITGRVVDEKNCALRQASIRIKNTDKGTLSDNNGNFSIKVKDNELDDTLTISYLGCQNREIPIISLKEEPNVSLYPSPVILQEISVSPTKFKKE